MSKPVLCKYLLKLATDTTARDRFKSLSVAERVTFLKTLGLLDVPAKALAELESNSTALPVVVAAVQKELQGSAAQPIHPHTIQLTVNL
jgi:hypothetical protein